jgi:hypothetical protein
MTGIMDSGATVTIGGTRKMFKDLRPCHVKVRCANNQVMTCSEMGTIVIASNNKGITIANSLYIPESLTLISISQLTRMGYTALFDTNGVELYTAVETKLQTIDLSLCPPRKSQNDSILCQ